MSKYSTDNSGVRACVRGMDQLAGCTLAFCRSVGLPTALNQPHIIRYRVEWERVSCERILLSNVVRLYTQGEQSGCKVFVS